MRIIAVDPGETIGLAWYDTDSTNFRVDQTSNVWSAEDWIWEISKVPQAHLIIEGYNSSGYMTKQAYNTVYCLGRLSGYMERDFGFPFTEVSPQARLSSVDQATEMIGGVAKGMYRNGRDAISALAHALSFAREYYGDD